MVTSQKQIFFNKVIDKSVMKHFIGRLVYWRGPIYTTHVLDQLKTLGFENSTKTGFSLGIDDLSASPLKTWIIQDAENETNLSQEFFRNGSIHAIEKLRQIVETWHTTSEFLKREMSVSFNVLDFQNPVHMMSFSGARGNVSQVHQLVGMRGLISDPQGNIVDLPIQNNLREGLSLTEYIISCYGARKGVVDTAIRTADAGYLTRRLVQIAQHIVVRNIDCNTPWGVVVRSIQIYQGHSSLSRENRLIGRVLARPIYINKRCIAIRNQDVGADLAFQLNLLYKKDILVRSTLGCKNADWTCQMCYGWGYIYGKMVSLGEAIGIIAGQSIGEPGTQLTLRTFHTGGVFTGDISNHIRAPFNGIVQFDSIKCQSTRNRHGRIVSKCIENLSLTITANNQKHVCTIPAYSLLFISNNQYVEAKQIMAEVRTSTSSLKEKVERHIYSTLEGEVVHTKNAFFVFQNNSNNDSFVQKNNGHVLVWSAYMFQFSDYQIQFRLFYKIEDYIDINLVIGNQNIKTTQKISDKFGIQSILVGSILKFIQFNNTSSGSIRFLKIDKNTFHLNILVLSIFNQFRIKILNHLLKKTENKQNYTNLLNQKKPQLGDKRLSSTLFIQRNNTKIMTLLTAKIITLAFNSISISSELITCIGLIGKTLTYFQYPYFCKPNVIKSLLIYCNFFIKYTPVWNIKSLTLFWIQINEKTQTHIYVEIPQLKIEKISHKICFFISITCRKINLGQFLWKNTFMNLNQKLLESGKTISISKYNIILRLTHTYLLTVGAIIHANCYDIINKGDMLITLLYEQLRTSDIIQGLPKAEQLLEARSVNEVVLKLDNSFFTLIKQIIRQIPNLIKNSSLSTQKSYHHSQIELVNRIQAVYLAQGVHILDKHIEIIVRQMSAKIVLVENSIQNNAINKYSFLPGELFNFLRVYKINAVIKNSIAYKPLLLGITRASLNTQSVISEASFQQTAKVLSKSALEGRIDWLKGLQENVIFGKLIPAGTNFQNITLEFTFANKIHKKSVTIRRKKIFMNQHYRFIYDKKNDSTANSFQILPIREITEEVHKKVKQIATQGIDTF
uniref:DNA-directed RNA polymerase subunit beta'' n=1 Tax=Cylindrocystis brebissonii TaxID=102167 RepID=A0A191T669_9VIRI|nr:beta'' subunit of RNA polymerase [Cylindrocystis brebissonii]ANI25889.1 beta'' subunit of RNA polymerase [Cylindrocystis brebissonii]